MSTEIIKKLYAKVKSATDSIDHPYGSFEIILSTPAGDRDGEELLTSQWELPLPDHITIDIDHGMSVATTVGSGVPNIDSDGNLVVSGGFASTDLGQQTRALVKERHIRTVSVTFLVKTTTNADGTKTVTRELLNGAFVAIPANTEAIVTEAKSLDIKIDEKALKAKKKSIIGSLEAFQDRVSDAVEDAYPQFLTYVIGTLPKSDSEWGVVVFQAYDLVTWEPQTFQETFSDDGSVTALAGDRKPVDIFEVVVPDADAESEPQSKSAADTTAAENSVAVVPSAENDEVEVLARSLSIQAEAFSISI